MEIFLHCGFFHVFLNFVIDQKVPARLDLGTRRQQLGCRKQYDAQRDDPVQVRAQIQDNVHSI